MKFAALSRVSTVAAMVATGSAAIALTSFQFVQPYAVSLNSQYEAVPLLSVGDTLPVTNEPGKTYQMVGIPDGLGIHSNLNGTYSLLMSHEFTNTTMSEPILGNPLNRGAIVSKLILNRRGQVLSGDRAYDSVYIEDSYVGPAADTTNSTPGFGRFCSGSLAGWLEGFDRPIYFANEETGASTSFDGQGGLSVAIFDNEAHALPALGRFPWENTLVQPNWGFRTVIMGMEDGPVSQLPADVNSQLYMYVGWKSWWPGATVLERNGLVGGTLYVFRSVNQNKNNEADFQNGQIVGEWVPIPGAGDMTEAELEAASDAVGAMVFARPEDGAFNPRNKNNYFFVTTGGAAGANDLGRLYSLELDKKDPTRNAKLRIVYNADQIIANGGDIALSPDNVGINWDYLTICEDGTSQSRPVMAAKNRDGSIWRLRLTGTNGCSAASAERIVELDPPGRDGVNVGPGVWETSGIIASEGVGGIGSWIFDVQAHSPTAAPAPNTIEDGQLMLLRNLGCDD